MTMPRRRRAALPALLAGALLVSLPGVVGAEEEIEGGAPQYFPTPLSQTDFLAPIKNMLGGRAGLIARAEDPTWAPSAGEDYGRPTAGPDVRPTGGGAGDTPLHLRRDSGGATPGWATRRHDDLAGGGRTGAR